MQCKCNELMKKNIYKRKIYIYGKIKTYKKRICFGCVAFLFKEIFVFKCFVTVCQNSEYFSKKHVFTRFVA